MPLLCLFTAALRFCGGNLFIYCNEGANEIDRIKEAKPPPQNEKGFPSAKADALKLCNLHYYGKDGQMI